MNFRVTKSLVLAGAAAALMVSAGAFACGQAGCSFADASASRWDIFLGYSYLAPKGTVQVEQPDGLGTIEPQDYKSVNYKCNRKRCLLLNKHIGAQGELGVHQCGNTEPDCGNNDGFTTGSVGLIFRYPNSDITPFAHALVGGARIGGPEHELNTWGPDGAIVGGAADYNTPFFNHHLAIRLFQADYAYMHADFGPKIYGGRANINAACLSAGVVWHIGSIAPPPPVTLLARLTRPRSSLASRSPLLAQPIC